MKNKTSLLFLLCWIASFFGGYFFSKRQHDATLPGKMVLLRDAYGDLEKAPENSVHKITSLIRVHLSEFNEAKRSPLRSIFFSFDKGAEDKWKNYLDRIVEIEKLDKAGPENLRGQ